MYKIVDGFNWYYIPGFWATKVLVLVFSILKRIVTTCQIYKIRAYCKTSLMIPSDNVSFTINDAYFMTSSFLEILQKCKEYNF